MFGAFWLTRGHLLSIVASPCQLLHPLSGNAHETWCVYPAFFFQSPCSCAHTLYCFFCSFVSFFVPKSFKCYEFTALNSSNFDWFALKTRGISISCNSLLCILFSEHRMYEVFWNTYMAKPAIDVGTVPDFIRIMYSVHKDVSNPTFLNRTSHRFCFSEWK